MRVVSRAKRKIAIVLAVVAIGAATAGCLPDNQGSIGPDDPTNNQIFQELNARRRAANLPEFGYSPKLGLDAQIWSAVMAQGTGLVHQDLNALLAKPDHGAYWTLGENILVGPWYMTGSIIVNLFMNSPPHRANILSGNFNVVGIGSSFSADGRLWVSLVFGGL
jgi:uncharacterized protein YkwD